MILVSLRRRGLTIVRVTLIEESLRAMLNISGEEFSVSFTVDPSSEEPLLKLIGKGSASLGSNVQVTDGNLLLVHLNTATSLGQITSLPLS